ncbi:MAG: hypothetical protein JXB10_20635 [Pirellulales bacterium]|nr:hypothetical protein [Pirellulales bacterium]
MGIIEHARDIAELIKKYNDQDLYERIVELREEILRLREENIELNKTVKQLTYAASTQEELIREGNCYYRKDDIKHEHPLCLACWDYDRKLVGLILGNDPCGTKTIRCNICSGRSEK